MFLDNIVSYKKSSEITVRILMHGILTKTNNVFVITIKMHLYNLFYNLLSF